MAKMALEAIKGEKTLAQLSSERRKHFLKKLLTLFSDRRKKENKNQEDLVSKLYRQIGQLKVELDWLKKVPNTSVEKMREFIDPENTMIPICRQCELLGLVRSSYYYDS